MVQEPSLPSFPQHSALQPESVSHQDLQEICTRTTEELSPDVLLGKKAEGSLVNEFVNETTHLSQLCEESTRKLHNAEERLEVLFVRMALLNFGILAVEVTGSSDVMEAEE
jgi:hypothetical protein